ncbi:sensor domain-containing protein [Dictyobacter aurantiacus]|uniref:Putative sensor domain-containing protein n=1 Tax=Dictyobacter aurantiacus TaxID=1936993 RepID=A0A401ZC78_9CHLR|nr:sensor domain-containing protein [Dictyobacter aurantiacus]GCE04501.1 hypothetical protein KDAU_18300 [Dictyobacter aurantiacus]
MAALHMQEEYSQTQRQRNSDVRYTLGNMLYLLLSFPLGIIYFVILVVGLSVGLGTVIVWIGLPILLLTLLAIRGIAIMERDLAANLLQMPMPYIPPRQPVEGKGKLLRWLRGSLSDAVTWKSMIYMLLKFPLGIISFVLVVTLPLIALGMTLEPLIYLLNLFIDGLVAAAGHHTHSYMFFIEIHDGIFDPIMFARTFIAVPIGLLVGWGSRIILNGLAQMCGLLARAMLCPSQIDVAYPKDDRYASMH